VPLVECLEVQILDDAWHENPAHYKGFTPVNRTGGIAGLVAPTAFKNHIIGEWHAMSIVARGRTLTVAIDGATVLNTDLDAAPVKGKNRPGMAEKSGLFALQSWQNRVEYRNLAVKRLTP